jgi:predicted esterase
MLPAAVLNVRGVSVNNFLPLSYTDTNGTLPYRLFIPTNYTTSSNYPIVLYLHGAGERGSDNTLQLTGETAELVFVYDTNQAVRPAFMVAPQCPLNANWTNKDIHALVSGIMNTLQSQYTIDSNRWYISGLSMGGDATWYYMITTPGIFAAGASAPGAFEPGPFTAMTNAPIWEFHGAGDGVIPVAAARNSVNNGRRIGGKVLYTEYSNANTHNIWPTAYANPYLQNWIFNQRRGTDPGVPPNLQITSPTSAPIYVNSSSASSLSLSGAANDGASSTTQVTWTNFVNGSVTASGVASGTASWSINSVPINPTMTNIIVVIGHGTVGTTTYTGETTFNDDLTVIPSQTMGTNKPVITWTAPASIVYGTPLDGTQLNASANVPGTFTYTPVSGTVLNAGVQALSLLFAPTDIVNYTNATATNVITVSPAPLNIRPDDKTMGLGGPLPTLTASYFGFTNGDTPANLDTAPTLNTTATISSPIGTYPITASGAADVNYSITYSNGTLTVVTAPPPALTLTSTNLLFSTFTGLNPASQSVGITNSSAGTLIWTAAVGGTGGAWLSVNPTSGIGNGTFAVNVDSTGLAPGIYSRTITVSATGASSSPQTIFVSLTVDSSTGAHYDLTYTNRAALLADGWSFLARTAAGATRDTEQTNGAVVSYDVAPGVLRVPADVGDLWQTVNTSRNSVFRNLPTNWVSIRLRVAAWAPTQNYQQAGLFAYQDDDTYVQVSRIYEDGQKIVLAREVNTAAANLNEPGLTTTTNLYLRMDRNPTNDAITGLYSTNSTTWISLGSVTQALANPRLGIITMASPSGFPNADFAWAEIITAAGAPILSVNTTNVNFTATQGGTNPPNQTITVTNAGGGILNWTNSIGGTGAVWLAVSPTNGSGNGTLTLSVNTTGLVAGVYNRTLAVNAGGVSGSPQTIYVALTVQPPPLLITWTNPGAIVYGTALSATQLDASANVAGTFSYAPSAGTDLSAGNSQTLTANFTPADMITYGPTSAVVSMDVMRAPLTINAQNQTKSYGAALPTFTASYTGFVNGDTASSLDTPVNLSTTATPSSNVGNYTIVASGAADANYTITQVNGTLTVTAAPLTVAADLRTKIYGDSDPALMYQITAGNLFGSDGFTGSLSRVAGENVGSYAINQGTLSAGGNYSLTFIPTNFTITPRLLTITAQDKTKSYGAALPTLTASYSGFVNGDTASNLDSPVSLSTTATSSSSVGSYTIVASGAVDANYTITNVNGILTVTPAALTVAADPQAKIYGDDDPVLTYQIIAGNLFGSDGFTGSLSRVAGENVGSYAINQGTLSAGSNYTLIFIPTNLAIMPRLLTITASNVSRAYGQTNPPLTAGYSGFANGENTNQLLGAPALTCDANTNSPVAGSPYSIIITNGTLSATNYSFAFVNGTLTVTQAPLTIIADDQTKLIRAPLPTLTATFNGFVNGETSDVLDSQVSLDTPATAASPIGDYPITASGAAAANYAITEVDGILTVANFQLNWIALDDAGTVTLQIDAPTNIPLVMEMSEDLQTWQPVPFTNNQDGTLTIENQSPTNGQQFYRGSVTLP